MPPSGKSGECARVVLFDPTTFEERAVDVKDLPASIPASGIVWIDVDVANGGAAAMAALQPIFGLHPLTVADALGPPQRAKYESYGTYDFILGRAAPEVRDVAQATEQLCIYLGDNWVISAHRGGFDMLQSVRERLRGGGVGRQQGVGYLVYSLLDCVIDNYFPVIESVGNRLENLEAAVLGPMDKKVLRRIQRARRDLMILRRAVWPMREVMSQIARFGEGRFDERIRPYLRDVYDETVQAIDLIEGYRDVAAGLIDLYLSTISFRTNEVMKVLTIISTIFLPLTFIAGVYGMNFDTSRPLNMPELHWSYGYLFSLGIMLACVIGLLFFFYRRGWLGETPSLEQVGAMPDSPKRGRLGRIRAAKVPPVGDAVP